MSPISSRHRASVGSMIDVVAQARTGAPAFRRRLLVLHLCLMPVCALASGPTIVHDEQNKRVTMSDALRNLVLCLSYNGKCILDQVSVGGRRVVDNAGNPGGSVYSAIKLGNQWFDSRACISTPHVNTTSNSVAITGI